MDVKILREYKNSNCQKALKFQSPDVLKSTKLFHFVSPFRRGTKGDDILRVLNFLSGGNIAEYYTPLEEVDFTFFIPLYPPSKGEE